MPPARVNTRAHGLLRGDVAAKIGAGATSCAHCTCSSRGSGAMTRGNQRDLARERNEKKTAAQGHKREGPRVAGVNPDAEALQKKVAEKQRLIAEGLLEEKQKSDKPKEKNLINPHTGKRDPEYTAKERLKAEGKR